jgi:predicted phosphodiesterase
MIDQVRIALISDVHGNTVALDAVIAEVSERTVDVVVCLGDVASNGPDPAGAIERMVEIGAVAVMGNTDAGLLDVPDWWHDPGSAGIPEDAHPGIEIGVWCADQLDDDHRRHLAERPPTAEVDLGPAGSLLAFHGSPNSFDDVITALTPSDELAVMLGGAEHAVLAGGHTHVPMTRRHGTQTLINPGSVGLPFAEYGYAGGARVLDHAAYALLSIDGPQVTIELRQVGFDLERLGRVARASGMPHADWWLSLRG